MILSCTGCGAPLDITQDLDIFACSFCGTTQRVNRTGSIVSLKKLEGAIKSIQRGTDKTAAELALPRLNKELGELLSERETIISALNQKRESAKRGRRHLAGIVFTITFFSLPLVIVAASETSQFLANTITWIWLIASVALPLWIYKKTKLPSADTSAFTAATDEKIEKIKQRLTYNRKILDDFSEN